MPKWQTLRVGGEAGDGVELLRRRVTNMNTALALGVTGVVVAAIAVGSWVFAEHHERQVLDGARTTARIQAETIRLALEHQMLEDRRDLVEDVIRSLARTSGVERILILDRKGVTRFASAPDDAGLRLSVDSPTCQACHALAPETRSQSVVFDSDDGRVLRTVVPIENQARCHGCHAPEQRINGVLIVDVPVGELREHLEADMRNLALGSGALGLGLLAALGAIMRVVVLRRLRYFEEAARGIAGGDLARRVPEDGNDTLAWLAREFNTVTDSASHLVGEVRRQREQLESVINSVDDGILVLDPDLNVVAANDALVGRFDLSRDALVGRTCHAAVGGQCNLTECPAATSFLDCDHHAAIVTRHVGESVRHEEVRSSPVIDDGGHVVQVVEVWRDITDRRASEARMSESHRLASLGMLASGFSHELNTPLGSAMTCVDGMLSILARPSDDPKADDETVRSYGKVARDQLLRCRNVTRQFLRLSRGESGTTDLLDARTVLEGVVPLVTPAARELGVTIEVGSLPPSIPVRAEEAGLQQVLLNLILNAVQACAKGGHVRVEAAIEAGARVSITDDGKGIAPEHLRKIFEPFFSLRRGGTGLGLFLCLNAVRGWGGDVRVESQVGKGTRFDVILPAARPGQVASAD